MKKTLLIIMSVIMIILATTSCTSESAINADPSELSNAIMQKYNFPAMYEVPSEELMSEFTVSNEYFSEVSAYTTEEPYGIERIFFGIVKEDADASLAAAELESYFQKIKDQSENYDPVEYAKAEDAKVFHQGNFVALVICEDSEGALDHIKELIK